MAIRSSELVSRRNGTMILDFPGRISWEMGSVGRYVADLVVDRKVIVETKVAKGIDPVFRAQVSNYLRASGLGVGLVVNFGSSVQFKRVVASPHRNRRGGQEKNQRPDADQERSQRLRGFAPRISTGTTKPVLLLVCFVLFF